MFISLFLFYCICNHLQSIYCCFSIFIVYVVFSFADACLFISKHLSHPLKEEKKHLKFLQEKENYPSFLIKKTYLLQKYFPTSLALFSKVATISSIKFCSLCFVEINSCNLDFPSEIEILSQSPANLIPVLLLFCYINQFLIRY